MALSSSQQQYISKMTPYAKKASATTGIDERLILAQWAHETGWGKSSAAQQLNNHAGIKKNASVRDYQGSTYAGYSTLDSWVKGYNHVMGLSYYKNVRAGKTLEQQLVALDKSPWAEDGKYGDKLSGVLRAMGVSVKDGLTVGKPSSNTDGMITLPENFLDLGQLVNTVNTADPMQLKKYAVVGVGVIMLMGLLGD